MRFGIYSPTHNPSVDPPYRYVSKHEFDKRIADGSLRQLTDRTAVETSVEVIESPKGLESKWASIANNAAQSRLSGICEICGFTRSIELAHIIPARFGGPAIPGNLLELCPNHHTLFDRDLLTWEEMERIWDRVGSALAARLFDPRLDSWRSRLTARYGVSFLPI